MESGLKALISKVFGDEKTMAQFKADPQSVISGYKLTEPEKKAVLHTCMRLSMAGADSNQLQETVEPVDPWW